MSLDSCQIYNPYNSHHPCPYLPVTRLPIQCNPNEPLSFQIISWYDTDVGKLDDFSLEEVMNCENTYNLNLTDPREYTMYVFGLTSNGTSVCAKLQGFKPFFYVKIPERWSMLEVDKFIKYIKGKRYYVTDASGVKVPYKYESSIVQIKTVKKLDLDAGFTNDELFPFLGIQFTNYDAMHRCSNMLWKDTNDKRTPAFGVKMYESNIQPILRFMHVQNILSIGWISFDAGNYKVHEGSAKETFCQIEVEAEWNDVTPDNDNNTISPIRQASFDIECFSVNGQVPIPSIEGNQCIQIATAIKDYGSADFNLKHIFTLKVSNPIDGAVVECCSSESDLLCRWARFIQSVDPDILIGYNIFGFDLEYIYVRAKITGCLEIFQYLSKFNHLPCQLTESQLSSSAYGDNHWQMVEMPGRSQIDLLPVIKKEKSYTSYKLGFVAEQILKESKHDLTPKELFEHYNDGSVAKITRVAEYCIQDTLLPQRIIDKMVILVNLIEMAKVTRVPLDFLVTRGQQIKVFSQIAETARNRGYLLPHIKKCKFVSKQSRFDKDPDDDEDEEDEEEGYEGATVLEPKVGSYWDAVAALDFKALYPTSEIDWNLCYTTLVKNDKKYGHIAGIPYHIEEIVMKKGVQTVELVIFEAANEIELRCKYYPKNDLPRLEKIGGMFQLPQQDPWVFRCKFPLRKQKLLEKQLPQATIKKIYKWAQNKQGLVPQILVNLLNARSKAKKQMEKAAEDGDKFMEDVYNGKQLALKVSCNSVYGFTGCAETGKLPCKPIAECTTTIGRGMIEKSKHYAENLENFRYIMQFRDFFPGNFTYIVMNNAKQSAFMGTCDLLLKLFGIKIGETKGTAIDDGKTVYNVNNDSFHVFSTAGAFQKVVKIITMQGEKEMLYQVVPEQGEMFHMQQYSCDVIYGDTDSVFSNFDTTMHDTMVNKIAYSMIVGAYVADRITEYLRSLNPFREKKWSELEYEKVYGNLLLFTKKRYTGTFYDFNPLKCKYIDKKGIALKRRDYCPLVKDVYQNSLDILFDPQYGIPSERILTAKAKVMAEIESLLQGNADPDKLILSKSLRDHYKIREKKKKKGTTDETFGPHNIWINDNVVISHPLLGETTGKVIVKHNTTGTDFFDYTARKMALEMQIETCQHDEYLPEVSSKYSECAGLPFEYADIIQKNGFEISLKKILDPRTTEAELEAVTQAHVRLTRRMYLRDPGSAPVSGERVPFMFVEKKGNVLQYEKAEHPDYVRLHNLKPDAKYYLDNQLRRPIEQLFALLMPDPESLFDPLIRKYANALDNQTEMTKFFQCQTTTNQKKTSGGAPKPMVKTKKEKRKRGAKDEKQISLQKYFSKNASGNADDDSSDGEQLVNSNATKKNKPTPVVNKII